VKLFRQGLEGAFLALAGAIPPKVAAHLLHLLSSRPDLTDRWGYHVRAIQYYDPVPDFRRITREQLERQRLSPAVNFCASDQLALANRLGTTYGHEIAALANDQGSTSFNFANPYFAGLDAAVYYALIRDLSPSVVVEIGSGYSTQIATKALARNAEGGRSGRLVCIEPFPESRLTESGARFDLIQKPVQDVPLAFFEALQAGDILMIDSSHVAATGSDVCFELLEILPGLKPGVWIHIHDIFLPADYPPEFVIERRLAFNEQYMLEAFLAYNNAFSIQLANAWLWRKFPEAAQRIFGGAPSRWFAPSASLWMRREG
jgi:hypothetical protein